MCDKIHESVENKSEEKPMMEKVGNYIANTYEAASQGLVNMKQNVFGKAEEDKTLGDKAKQEYKKDREILGDKI